MMMAILILGLKAMQDAAAQITFVDIYNRFDDTVRKKIHSNPLKRSFQVLSDILLQDSQESYERESRKAKQDKATKQNKPATAKNLTTAKPSTSQPIPYETQAGISDHRGPSTSPITVTPVKRKASESSFGKRSTETTPSKTFSPEANIQILQSQLVYDVLDALYYDTAIPVAWVRNREIMMIKYTSFVHSWICH